MFLPTDGESFDSDAIQTDVQMMGLTQASDVIPGVFRQTNLDDVLTVEPKVMTNGDSAPYPAGSPWGSSAEPDR